jgi:hypothetical protein
MTRISRTTDPPAIRAPHLQLIAPNLATGGRARRDQVSNCALAILGQAPGRARTSPHTSGSDGRHADVELLMMMLFY